MTRQRKERGFTLIELMIVVAIIGILAAIAIPAFLDYMNKGKKTEASLQLDNMGKKVNTFHIEKSRFPAAGTPLPAAVGSACAAASGKMAKLPQSSWTGGWQEMQFHIDEDSYYTYEWAPTSATTGLGTAIGDLDCDGTMSTYDMIVNKVEGNLQIDFPDATAD